MAVFVKELAPKQLLTIGTEVRNRPPCSYAPLKGLSAVHMAGELVADVTLTCRSWQGFFAADSPHADANPGDWAGQSGQSFLHNHEVPGIDFATVRAVLVFVPATGRICCEYDDDSW